MKDETIKILGLSFHYHDAAAALLIDGVPAAMSGEERFSRKKHDSDYPRQAIKFVLESTGTAPEELDWVVFYEKPFVKFDRLLKTLFAMWPRTPFLFSKIIRVWFADRLWVRSHIAEGLGISPKKVLFSGHHLSHAASAFLCSPYEKAAILSVDGVGEWASAAIYLGNGNQITPIKEIDFPHSLGLLYSTFTAFLGFEVNEGEYKVMGMAPYGAPKYAEKIKKLLTIFPDGSFRLNLEYFDFYRSDRRSYSKKFVELFGKPRDQKSKFFTRNSGWPNYFGDRPENWEELAKEQEYYADLAASIQKVTEEIVVGLSLAAGDLTDLDALCYAGGVALNSVANQKILEQTPFKKIFIQPAAGDAGGALGAALCVYYSLLNKPRKFLMDHVYYGAEYSDEEIEKFLQTKNIPHKRILDDESLFEYCADKLVSGKVIGWFSGRFEWGPRALGSRSILADPRRADMKDIVNTKIKFREPYRPFAPSILSEKFSEYFEMSDVENQYPARFMLYVLPVKDDKKSAVPAIVHVDGTARPQAVFKNTSPRYWKLIKKFEEKTGVPLVLNTSFNLKGEPIVTTPENAYNTFMSSGLDVLVLENFIVEKEALKSSY